jgi:hypothetical protein
MTHYNSFLLRVWRNVGEDGPQWAGRLEHLQRGESVPVSSLEELVEHIRARAGPLAVRQDDPLSRRVDTEK